MSHLCNKSWHTAIFPFTFSKNFLVKTYLYSQHIIYTVPQHLGNNYFFFISFLEEQVLSCRLLKY